MFRLVRAKPSKQEEIDSLIDAGLYVIQQGGTNTSTQNETSPRRPSPRYIKTVTQGQHAVHVETGNGYGRTLISRTPAAERPCNAHGCNLHEYLVVPGLISVEGLVATLKPQFEGRVKTCGNPEKNCKEGKIQG